MERSIGQYGENSESLKQATEAAQLRDVMRLVMYTLPAVNAAGQSVAPYTQLFQYAYKHHQALVDSLVERHAYIPKLIVQQAVEAHAQRFDPDMLWDLEQEGLLALIEYIHAFDPRYIKGESAQSHNFKVRIYNNVVYKISQFYGNEIGVSLQRRKLNKLIQLDSDTVSNYGLHPPQEQYAPLDINPDLPLQEEVRNIVTGRSYAALSPNEHSVVKDVYNGTAENPISHIIRLKLKEALLR